MIWMTRILVTNDDGYRSEGIRALADALASAGVEGAVYEDANDPHGVGILSVTKDPNFFVSTLRGVLNGRPFESLVAKPELTMLGRTYALGYEPDYLKLQRAEDATGFRDLLDPKLRKVM